MSKPLRLRNRASYLRVPRLAITEFEIRSFPIEDLHCPCRDVPIFAEELAESIAREGLANPVIVVRGPREDLERELHAEGGSGKSLPDTPVVNCVWGGTNRISAARRLGYTHVDCVVLPTFDLALRLQDLQRESYNATETRAVGTEDGV